MEYTLNLTFICTNGKKSTLTIEGVKHDLSDANVTALMNLIIDKNIFTTSNGAYVKISGATLTASKTTKYLV